MLMSNIVLLIIILILLGILITLIIFSVNNAKALNYTFFNEIYCPGTTSCVLDPEENLTLPENWDYLIYNKEIARISLDLITRIVNETTTVPYEDFILKAEFSTSLDSKTLCCIWETKDTIWLTFRGTDNLNEWVADSKVKQLNYEQSNNKYKNTPSFMQNDNKIMIHDGFLSIFSEVADEIVTTISTIDPDKKKTICVSGHSLGAALATIFGLELYSLGYLKTCVYSFASPRLGNLQLKDYYSLLNGFFIIFRIVNTEDVVPQAPTTVSPNFKDVKNPFFYSHFGTLISFSENAKSLTNNHSLFVYNHNLQNYNPNVELNKYDGILCV